MSRPLISSASLVGSISVCHLKLFDSVRNPESTRCSAWRQRYSLAARSHLGYPALREDLSRQSLARKATVAVSELGINFSVWLLLQDSISGERHLGGFLSNILRGSRALRSAKATCGQGWGQVLVRETVQRKLHKRGRSASVVIVACVGVEHGVWIGPSERGEAGDEIGFCQCAHTNEPWHRAGCRYNMAPRLTEEYSSLCCFEISSPCFFEYRIT